MKTKMIWQDKLFFTAEADGHHLELDAKSPLGTGKAPTPKELLVLSVAGCSAMDIAALMRKHRQPVESFEVEADATLKEGSKPQVFSQIRLTFSLGGELDPTRVSEAAHLSMTQYCGVSAMLSKTVPISYVVVLNGQEIGRGEAAFQ